MMDSKQKKRKRSSVQADGVSEKRQKIRPKGAGLVPSKRQSVGVDSLSWNDVQVPDLLNDAEGFFGLQEIEDVEVIREGDVVQFFPLSKVQIHSEDEFEGLSDEAPDERKGGDAKTRPTVDSPKKQTALSKGTSKKDFIYSNPSMTLGASAFSVLAAYRDTVGVDVSDWQALSLSADTLSSLLNLRFSKPTPIQRAAIPEILAGHDVVGKASTGSGKTLAFGIPILERWLETNLDVQTHDHSTSTSHIALILSPTRELAHQLAEHIVNLCKSLPRAPRIATITGGLSAHKQQRLLAKADIVVATAGRLWEVMSSSTEVLENLQDIRFLVLDEADRLLADGHFKEIEDILTALDRQQDTANSNFATSNRQTLVFSATFDKGLQQKLAGKGKQGLMNKQESMEYLLKKLNFREERPKFVDVNPVSQMAENLREGLVECAGTEKDLYLYALLLYHRNQRALIFTNSITSVRRLTPLLQGLGLPAQSLHSQMIQKARLRSVERFSSSKSPGSILVATDVAARGLDIRGIDLIIHYHLPRAADAYVHRSGRTARGELSGSSILLCAPEEVVGTRRLVAKVHAQNAVAAGGKASKYYMRSLDLDRRVIARLKPRVELAKKITDSALAKEKKDHNNDWIRNAAEELGVDYDSEEFEAAGGGRKGRGTGRKQKEKEARSLTKAEVGALRAELKQLLAQRVNVGVSERYLTSGSVDVDELLRGAKGDFLGKVDGISDRLEYT